MSLVGCPTSPPPPPTPMPVVFDRSFCRKVPHSPREPIHSLEALQTRGWAVLLCLTGTLPSKNVMLCCMLFLTQNGYGCRCFSFFHLPNRFHSILSCRPVYTVIIESPVTCNTKAVHLLNLLKTATCYNCNLLHRQRVDVDWPCVNTGADAGRLFWK